LDPAGNVYVTGGFQATTDFDAGAGTFDLAPSQGRDQFVLKEDNDGNFVWATSVTDREARGLALDPSGNIYTIGGAVDVVITKLGSSGSLAWQTTFASSDLFE